MKEFYKEIVYQRKENPLRNGNCDTCIVDCRFDDTDNEFWLNASTIYGSIYSEIVNTQYDIEKGLAEINKKLKSLNQ